MTLFSFLLRLIFPLLPRTAWSLGRCAVRTVSLSRRGRLGFGSFLWWCCGGAPWGSSKGAEGVLNAPSPTIAGQSAASKSLTALAGRPARPSSSASLGGRLSFFLCLRRGLIWRRNPFGPRVNGEWGEPPPFRLACGPSACTFRASARLQCWLVLSTTGGCCGTPAGWVHTKSMATCCARDHWRRRMSAGRLLATHRLWEACPPESHREIDIPFHHRCATAMIQAETGTGRV